MNGRNQGGFSEDYARGKRCMGVRTCTIEGTAGRLANKYYHEVNSRSALQRLLSHMREYQILCGSALVCNVLNAFGNST